MRVVAGAILVLAGAVLFAGGAVAQAIQITVDRYGNFHLVGIELGMPAGGLLSLVGLVVVASSFWAKPGSRE